MSADAKTAAACPRCGCTRLFGPAVVISPTGKHRYYDCPRCHCLVVEDRRTGRLVAKAGAW